MTTHRPVPLPARAILSAEERAMLAAYMEEQAQQSQWPFDQAAKVISLPAELLRKLVRDGVLTGKAYWRTGDEVMGWCDIIQAREIAAQLDSARQLVEGNSIPVPEAIEKYRFSKNGVYSWIRSGWIKKIGTDSNGDMLINEGDIAFARALADLTHHRKAKALFPQQKTKN